jgi:P-type Ca2+ transporter type 2C
MILMLLASAVISIILGQYNDAISIFLATVIVSTVAFIQNYRSEKALEALKELVTYECTVLREGKQIKVNGQEIVGGDIVIFSVGDRISADLRIIESNQLSINESTLTGEIKPKFKYIKTIEIDNSEEENISNRINIAYMGSLVTSGTGKGIVKKIYNF